MLVSTRGRGRPRNDGTTAAVTPAAVAVSPVRPQVPPAVVWTPEQVLDPVSVDSHLSQAVIAMMRADRPQNSINVKDPKIQEFKDYCTSQYKDGLMRWGLWPKKIYLFMFFQAMRPQRKRGGRGGNPGKGFDDEEYKTVLASYREWMSNPTSPPVGPEKPIGISQFVHYMLAIKDIWEDLSTQGFCSLTWEQLWNLPLKNLLKYVKGRKETVRRANYMEKLDHEFAPYQAIEDFPRIEEALWEKGARNYRSAYAYLRHRFCLLFSTSGILRCESLYKAELSDFLGLAYKQDTDVHKFYMMIMQISTGKFPGDGFLIFFYIGNARFAHCLEILTKFILDLSES
jgi:hypothetical protein